MGRGEEVRSRSGEVGGRVGGQYSQIPFMKFSINKILNIFLKGGS